MKPLLSMARKERVPVKITVSPVEYWIAFVDDKAVGFQGATIQKTTIARLKSTFVHPNYRGSGIFDKLFNEAITNLTERGITTFSGFFTPMSYTTGLRYGFKERSRKEGLDIVFAVKEI